MKTAPALVCGLGAAGSKLRPARHRYWFFLLAEGIEAFPISAARFNNRSLRFARAHLEVHRLHKGCRIFDGDLRLQSVAAVDQVIALHDMKLIAVGRAEIVDEGPRVLSDGIDHQPLALVMADRFSVPGWFRIRRMWHVQVDVTHSLIALADRDHFLGRLNEENRLHNAVDSDGNSGRPA